MRGNADADAHPDAHPHEHLCPTPAADRRMRDLPPHGVYGWLGDAHLVLLPQRVDKHRQHDGGFHAADRRADVAHVHHFVGLRD